MRRLWNALKQSCKGFTLVEVVCAVAIFSTISVAVGGAMVQSAKNYQRGSVELDLQKDAQSICTLVGNMLIDADKNSITVTTAGFTLSKTTDVVRNYAVAQNASNQLVYTAGTESVTLAEGVTNFALTAYTDVDNAHKPYYNIRFTLTKGGKSFDADYDITPRNGEYVAVTTPVQGVRLFVQNELLLEPGQSYDLPVTIVGTGNTAFTVADGVNVHGDTSITATAGQVHIETALAQAGDNFTFTVTSSADTSISQTVTVKVRRATSVTLAGTKTAGVDLMKDAEYTITGNVGGTNLNRISGVLYDVDYVNPYYIKYDIRVLDGSGNVVANPIPFAVIKNKTEDINTPICTIKLAQDLPQGYTIQVIGYAKHPLGLVGSLICNKATKYNAGVQVQYANDVFGIWELKTKASYFKRADDTMLKKPLDVPDVITSGDYDSTVKQLFQDVRDGSNRQWQAYFRVRELGATLWSPYRFFCDNGSSPQLTADYSMCFLPDRAYEFEYIVVYKDINGDGKRLYWPYNEDLLNQDVYDRNGNIFRFTKAWGSVYTGSGNPIDEKRYTKQLMMGIPEVVMKPTSQPGTGTTEANPLRITSGNTYQVDMDRNETTCIAIGKGIGFWFVAEKKVNGVWTNVNVDYNGYVDGGAFRIRMDNQCFYVQEASSSLSTTYRIKLNIDPQHNSKRFKDFRYMQDIQDNTTVYNLYQPGDDSKNIFYIH